MATQEKQIPVLIHSSQLRLLAKSSLIHLELSEVVCVLTQVVIHHGDDMLVAGLHFDTFRSHYPSFTYIQDIVIYIYTLPISLLPTQYDKKLFIHLKYPRYLKSNHVPTTTS